MTSPSTKKTSDKCYKALDWPAFDLDLFAELREKSLKATRGTGHTEQPWLFSILKTPWSLREWAIENLPLDITDKWVVAFQRFQESEHVAPHRDDIRKTVYNCLLTDGGPITQFYDDRGKVFESVVYEKNQWYYHNASITHGVQNTGAEGAFISRTAVSVFKLEAHRYASGPARVRSTNKRPNINARAFVEAYRKDPFFYYE